MACMDIQEYDVVRLKRNSGRSQAGWRGTALLMHGSPPVACEVEFTDGDGKTLAIETVRLEDLEMVIRPENPGRV